MTSNDDYIFWLNNPTILYKKYLEFIPTSKMSRVKQLNALTRLLIYFIILCLLLNKPSEWFQLAIVCIIFIIFLYFIFKKDTEGMKNELLRMRGIDINSLGDEDYPENKDEDNEDIIIKSGYYDSDNNLRVDKYLSNKPAEKKKVKFNLDDHTLYEKAICQKPNKDNPFINPLLNDITLDGKEEPVPCNVDDKDVHTEMIDCYNEDIYKNVGDLFEKQNSIRQFYTVPRSYPNDQQAFANFCYKNDNICKVDQSKCLKNEDLRYKRLMNNV